MESVPHAPQHRGFHEFAAPPARPASLAYSSTAAGYGSGTTANPYASYSTTAPVGYNGTPNNYSNNNYAGYPSNTQASSQVYNTYPNYNTPSGAYTAPAAQSYTNPAYQTTPASNQYPTVANNPYPPASMTSPGTYPSTATQPCNGNNCPLPGADIAELQHAGHAVQLQYAGHAIQHAGHAKS